MKLLLDTCKFLWIVTGDASLSAPARKSWVRVLHLQKVSNLFYVQLCALQDGAQRAWWNVLSRMHGYGGATAGIVTVAQGHVATNLSELHESCSFESAHQPNPVGLGQLAQAASTSTIVK
jgi:hypothetical protein